MLVMCRGFDFNIEGLQGQDQYQTFNIFTGTGRQRRLVRESAGTNFVSMRNTACKDTIKSLSLSFPLSLLNTNCFAPSRHRRDAR